MPISAKLSQLLITPGENDRSMTSIYISEPTPLEEKNFGIILSIIDIESQDPAYEEIINLINEEITQNYYRSTDLEVELAFENTLNLLNRKLQQVTAELGEEWFKKINACIAVLKKNQLHFTQIGSINILLAQKNQINKLNESQYNHPNPLKIFSNISSGQLTINSAMIFCTESILDYLSQEKIKKTLQENNPTETTQYLQNLLQENSNSTNFAAIILKMLPQKSVTKDDLSKQDQEIDRTEFNEKNDSMKELVSQENNTNELLSPSLWPGLKKNIQKIKNNIKPVKIKKIEGAKSSSQAPVATTPLTQKTGVQKTIIISKKILIFLKNISLQILAAIIWIIRKMTSLYKNPKTYSSQFNSIPDKAGGVVSKTINWFKKLSTPRKVFIILFIVILFIFSQSIIRQGQKQEKRQEQKQYAESLSTVSNKLGEAESKIIMNDFAGARALAKEASDLMSSIPKDSKTWEEKGEEQKNKLKNIQDQVNFVNRISEPNEVANFSSLGLDTSLNKISLISTNIFSFSENNIYRFNLDDNEASLALSETNGKIKSINKDSAATILALMEDQTFMQFNPVLEKLSPLSIDFDNQDLGIIDLKVFGSRLYTLDPKNNQIFKNTKTGDNYGLNESWLEDEEVELKNAISFAIDGAIFILKDNGKIIRLFSGHKDNDWQLEEIQPSLEGATKIFTDDSTTNLYVLDSSTQRVVIFDKKGKLLSQYVSDKWNDLKDMYVEEANNKIYLLNGTQVFEINLQ